MRRVFSAFLLLLILAGLTGCGNTRESSYEFFYLRTPETYDYGTEQAVVASEDRSFPSPIQDTEYLLRLYLDGPVSETLRSPFPQGTRLLTLQHSSHTLTIRLSEEYAQLSGIRLSMAAACLAKTCFQLTDAENLIVLSGTHVYTYSRGSFLFLDDSALPTE